MTEFALGLAGIALLASIIACIFVLKIYWTIKQCYTLARGTNANMKELAEHAKELDKTFAHMLSLIQRKAGATDTKRSKIVFSDRTESDRLRTANDS